LFEIHAPHRSLGQEQNFAGATNKNPIIFDFEIGPKRILFFGLHN
jgi:hypothetical protein